MTEVTITKVDCVMILSCSLVMRHEHGPILVYAALEFLPSVLLFFVNTLNF
jgi:hypothetical protein